METLRNIIHKFLNLLTLCVCVHKYTQWLYIIYYVTMCYTHIYMYIYTHCIYTCNDKYIKYMHVYINKYNICISILYYILYI